jgi:hypothetical protein
MHGARNKMQKIREKFYHPQVWAQAALRFLATATTLAAQRIGRTKTAGTVGPVDTGYQNVHGMMRTISNKFSCR